MKKPLLCLFVLALSSCGGNTASNTSPQKSKETLPPALEEKLRRIMSASKCTSEDCDLVEIEAKPQSPVRPNVERIMIIDNALVLPALTRYRNKTAAIYRLNRDAGSIEEYKGSIEVAKDAMDFYKAIQDFPKHVPVALTNPFRLEFLNKFGPWLQVEGVVDQHGRNIFNYIADKNPDNELVAITDFVNIYPDAVYCHLDQQDNYAVALESATRIAQDIRELAQKWNVTYINLSAGSEAKRFYHNFKKMCTNQPNEKMMAAAMRLWHVFLEEISTIEGTYLIQAGITSSTKIDPTSIEVLSDCASFKNRARIGFYVDFYDHVGKAGSALKDPAKRPNLTNTHPCLDLAINSGFTNTGEAKRGDAPLLVSKYGVGERISVWGNGTSWMAPVALSMINRMANDRKRSNKDKLTPKAMIEALKKDGKISLYDPIYHEQFESFIANP